MQLTNERIKKVKPSETLAVKAKAMELAAQGRSIIDLSTGEPDIDTPEHIKEAARVAMQNGRTKYTPVNGILELREALATKLTNENGVKTDASCVIVTNGGKQAIESLFEVTLNPGDEVVITAPYWVSYPPMVELCGGKPVIVHTKPENGYKMTPAELEKALSPKTRFVIINSPSNPTGVAYTAEEQKQFGEVISKTNALVLSDEVYEKVTFGDFKFKSFAAAFPQLADRTVTINAFSKTYSMTGWRVGYASGPKEIIAAMGRHQSQTTSNVCSIAQYAAVGALKGPHDFVNTMLDNFTRRFDIAMGTLEGLPGVSVPCKPRGAFYLFIRFDEFLKAKGISGSAEFCNYLLDKAGVASVPGEAFGDDRAIRISVGAADQTVKEGCERIRKAVLE